MAELITTINNHSLKDYEQITARVYALRPAYKRQLKNSVGITGDIKTSLRDGIRPAPFPEKLYLFSKVKNYIETNQYLYND